MLFRYGLVAKLADRRKVAGEVDPATAMYYTILGASFKTLSLSPTEIANMFYESEFYNVDQYDWTRKVLLIPLGIRR
jgi:hypothetical protein